MKLLYTAVIVCDHEAPNQTCIMHAKFEADPADYTLEQFAGASMAEFRRMGWQCAAPNQNQKCLCPNHNQDKTVDVLGPHWRSQQAQQTDDTQRGVANIDEFVAKYTPQATPPCSECGGSGWAVHPENGWNKDARRCSRGCASRCSVCGNPNCDNPNGQH